MFEPHKLREALNRYSRTKEQQKAFFKRMSDRQKVFKDKADKQPINLILK